RSAFSRTSTRRRTSACNSRTSGEGGCQAGGLRSRAYSAMARASAESVLFAWPSALAVGLDPGGVGHAHDVPGVGQGGGRRITVRAGGLQAVVQRRAAGVAVGPAAQGGVPAGVGGELLLARVAVRGDQAGVEGVLGHVDADEGGSGGRLAHGVLPSGSWMRGVGRLPPPG